VPITAVMTRSTLLAVALMLAGCTHSARPDDQLWTGCKACEAALGQERMQRAKLESELAALRTRLESEVEKNVEAQLLLATLRARDPADRQLGSLARAGPPSRTLLQEPQADPQCSMTELLAVQANPVAAVTAMFTTNFLCAICLVPCASAAVALDCAMGCLKQDEGDCANEDLSAVEAVGMPSSLADRAQLVRILEVAARACVRCILETIAFVCGVGCVTERLHLVTDYTYSPRSCLPELAARISVGEASAFERVVAANEPFGLTVGAQTGLVTMADVFVPTVGPLQQHKVYKGVDSGMLAYECDPTAHGRAWALLPASSTNGPSWADCSGSCRIDLDSGEARTQPAGDDGSRVPIRFDLQWADCSAFLPFDGLEPSTTHKALDGPAQSKAAACWLSRFFGPQATWHGPPSFTITIAIDTVALQTDLVVRSGSALRITSSTNATIAVGPHQIRVETGARLEIEGLRIADSVHSSALVVRGSASAARCTFIRCIGTTNLILSGVFDSFVPDGVGACLSAGAGAVHIAPTGTMEIVDSALLQCGAAGAKVAALGGAIVVDSKAHLQVLRSELRQNYVAGGSFGCGGGAIQLLLGATATIRDSTLNENAARGGAKLSIGGAINSLPNARLTVRGSELCYNVVVGESEYTNGGALLVHTSVQFVVSDSLVCHNRAEQTGVGGAFGGAVATFPSAVLTVERSALQNNTARGGLYAGGGAVYVLSSEATFERATFLGNSAEGALVRNNGGAISVFQALTLRVLDSEMRENVAIGKNPEGGAVSTESVDSAVLLNTSLLRNRVVTVSGVGGGGAVSVSEGLVRLRGCRVHGNVAESLRSGNAAAGGGVFVISGEVLVERTSFRGNLMGGLGIFQADASRVGGAHIAAYGGHVVLEGCSVTDDGGEGEDSAPPLLNAAEWWMVAEKSLALRNSSFRGLTPGRGVLRLQASRLELVIRGCEFENVAIGAPADGASVRPIGIVDSTFEPALDRSVPTIQPPSGKANCGVELAGERLCDPRALCENVTKGGVRCSCVGAGLRYKPGVHEDGRQCEQDTSLRAVLESQSVVVAIAKPGSLVNHTLALIVEARGEAELSITFNVTITRFEASSGAVVPFNGSVRIDQPFISAFGQHLEWTQRPPTATWPADLDSSRLKFAATSRHEFSVRLACDRAEQSCAADGDIIMTTVQLAPQDGRLMSQEVMVPL
jgi:hypothetical protein